MSITYFVRGTISVQVDGNRSTISITPCPGFLTPDKQYVIAFPVSFPKGKTKGKTKGKKRNAKLIKSSKDQQFRFRAKAIRDHIPTLLDIAAQQKTIELHLKKFAKPATTKITGFVFPAPSDHAHGR